MDPEPRSERRANSALKTLGYIYSIGVFITATALATQHHLGYLDVDVPQTAKVTTSVVPTHESKNQNSLQSPPGSRAQKPLPPGPGISSDRGRAPAAAPSRPDSSERPLTSFRHISGT